MTTTARTPLYTLLTWLGLVLGVGQTIIQIAVTSFPVDMAIYRDGVRAFMSGGEMYSVPMHAGDLSLPFIYPPFGALVMVPLTAPGFLDDNVAGDIVIATSNLLILVCLYIVWKAIAGAQLSAEQLRMATAVTWACALLIEPVRLNNSFAQINIVLMALVVIDLVPKKRHRWPQGILVGIAAAIKLTPLVFGLYFLLRKDWKAIATTAISAVVCTLLAAVWRCDATMEFYFGTLVNMGKKSQIGVDTTYQSNSSIKGMVMRFSPDGQWLEAHGTLVNIIWFVLSLATVIAGALIIRALLRRGMDVDALLVTSIVMLLISPVSWSHHWVWLALIIPVFTWRAITVLGAKKALYSIVGLWSVLILSYPPKWWFGDAIDLWALDFWQIFLISDFVWFAYALLIALAVGLKSVPVASAEAQV